MKITRKNLNNYSSEVFILINFLDINIPKDNLWNSNNQLAGNRKNRNKKKMKIFNIKNWMCGSNTKLKKVIN